MVHRLLSRKFLLALAAWLVIISLLWLTWRTIEWRALAAVLSHLTALQLGTLFLINVGIFLLMSVRWWWILRTMGYPVSILTLARYRLTSFGINYFTPGPQFGGEPYQVYMLTKKKDIPLEISTSSVAFDKLIELLANFGFLLFGFWTVVRFGFLGDMQGFMFLSLTLLVILVICLYLISLYLQKNWAVRLISRVGGMAEPSRFWRNVFRTIAAAEKQTARAIRTHPGLFVISLGLSVATWVALVFEYRLTLVYLGSDLALPQTIGVLTAARIAFLFPFPGGLGSLEFSQVFAMQALGAGTAIGVSMGLLIWSRDILFGGIGLAVGGVPLRRISKLEDPQHSHQKPSERNGSHLSSEEREEISKLEIHKKTV